MMSSNCMLLPPLYCRHQPCAEEETDARVEDRPD
jgi:hypothetical protein